MKTLYEIAAELIAAQQAHQDACKNRVRDAMARSDGGNQFNPSMPAPEIEEAVERLKKAWAAMGGAVKVFKMDSSPWVPMTDPVDVKHLLKLCEETSELGSAAARCLMQGIDEAEPSTGKLNREWIEDEIGDVRANIDLNIERFKLDEKRIELRKERKKVYLRKWHGALK